MTTFLHGEVTYYLRGIGFRVHNALKGGHKEAVYERAVLWVLDKDNVPYESQKKFIITYKGKPVGTYYPDLMLTDGKVLVDFKAAPAIMPLHKGQVISYLGVTGAELGFLMNFGANALQTERLPNFLSERRPLPWQPLTRTDILFPELTNQILASLHTVHHTLGIGFLHQIYRRATRIELAQQGITVLYLKTLPLRFETEALGAIDTRFFLIENKLLLSTIAVKTITTKQTELLRWAMQVTQAPLGLIANFHSPALETQFIRANVTTKATAGVETNR
jgi:GxxExxY protein